MKHLGLFSLSLALAFAFAPAGVTLAESAKQPPAAPVPVKAPGAAATTTAPTSAITAATSAPAEPAAPLELKNKSSFKLEGNTRNPFWPIGWKPSAKIAQDNAASTDHGGAVTPAAFLVSSITLGNTARFAIINGKIMQEGQQFGLQLGNQTFQVTVKRIEDGRVIIGRRDQEIEVPLRRK
jgi:hypothetical protein